MKNKAIGLLMMLAIALSTRANPIEEGKQIFMSRCASCHNVNRILTGPALAGVDRKYPIDWIIRFVQSSQSVIRSGDDKAIAIYQKFNKIPMPDHSDLTGEQIRSVVEFIKQESAAAESGTKTSPTAKGSALYHPLTIQKNYGMFITFLLAVALLIGTLLFLVRLRTMANGERDQM